MVRSKPSVSTHRGFSLVELLVALAILSMTILIATNGFSYFMSRWGKQLSSFEQDFTNTKHLYLAYQSVSKVSPYVVETQAGTPGVFFEGNEDSFIAVTASPIFGGDVPAALRISVRQNDDLLFDLVYEEALLVDGPLITPSQRIDFTRQTILLSGLSDIKIHYLGFRNLTEKVNNRSSRWWTTFNGFQRQLMPEVIRITFLFEGKEQTLMIPVSQLDSKNLGYFSDGF